MPDGSTLPEAAGNALYNEQLRLGKAVDIVAAPAQRATLILASKATDLPKEFTRVAVYPNGGGLAVEALPSGAG